MAFNDKYQKLLVDFDKHCQAVSKATEVKLGESEKAKHERIKTLESDYVAWFEYYFPNYAKVKCAWFHKKLANSIIRNNKISLLAEFYRGAGKSVHIDMGIPLFLMFVLNDLKFMLLIGETEPKAQKLISGIQAQIQYNKRLINDYGEQYNYGDWSTGDFVTKQGIRFMALGFGQNPRGAREGAERPDYIVVDDVDNRKHFKNNELMTNSVDYITEDVWGCFDNMEDGTERFIFANNNTHKNSITNRLKLQFKNFIKKAKEDNDKPIHHIITVCAVKDLVNFIPEWPEKASCEYWKKKYRNTTYKSFMREYMHVHIEEGKVFKYEWFQWRPRLRYDQYDVIVFYGDLSFKDNACYKGLICVGKKENEFDILHVFLRQTSRPQLAKWLYDLYEKNNLEKYSIKYRFEGLFAMDDFVNDFDHEGEIRGYYIPVVPDKRPKADKHDRIEASSAFFERRKVFFNEAEKNNSDQIELKDQFLAFEKGGGSAVDGPDAFEGALAECNRTSNSDRFPPRLTSYQDLINQSKNRF